ncbi:lipoprotein-releasing ABC transporter permease subunit [Thalassotalea piscium]|uniref:Lipoprotein-releasing system permease protein n=1 Tax=Thalassotalea piscium TaxID=1230533 RepID=A0A7X0TVB3_9GAMM|nr:lipoprotein-releasing ABC transporter permease subunit [Thalassotalea piscium]MBB6544994.1 lipoprotein-releasing system permease protein [Thalassotalea piscium]
MFQPVSFFIGLRYSKSRSRTGFVSFITFFSIVGILLGVASLITVVSVMNGFEGELKKRILGLVPHVLVATKDQSPFEQWQPFREELLTVKHVKQVTPLIESEALVQSTSAIRMILMQGLIPEFEQHNIVANRMTYGQLHDLNTHRFSVVMGESLARELKVDIGEKVRLLLPNKTVFTPMGRMPMQRTFTLVGLFNVGSQVDDSMVYLTSESAAKMLRRQDNDISQLRLYLDDAFNVDYVIADLKQKFPQFKFTSWKVSQGSLFGAVKMEKNMMGLSLALIIAVAAFNIVSALVMVVIDKRGEIAILQTFGMTRYNIVKIFISQGMINGLWGTLFGVVLGVLLALNLNALLSALGLSLLGGGSQELPIALNSLHVLVIAFSAIAMSFLATLYPAYHASKTLPAEVLRNE